MQYFQLIIMGLIICKTFYQNNIKAELNKPPNNLIFHNML